MRLKIFFKKISITFLFFLAATAIFWPILFDGKIIDNIFGLDLSPYKFIKDFGSQWRNQGSLKLWWSDYFGGFPVYLTQTGFFTPLVFIFYKFFSGFTVYNWLIFFNFILGGLAMYWFAKNLKLSKISSIICGLAYVFSQNNLYWGPTLVFSNLFVFIPLFFGVLLKISEDRKSFWFWGILITGYGLIAAETQIVFFTLVIGFLWAIFLVCQTRKARPIFGYLTLITGGAILASFWILPVLNYLNFTTRSHALSFENLVYDFMRIADPLRFFYPFIELPQFTGLVSLGIVSNYYIGTLVFLLAIASIFLIKKNKTVSFWFGVAAFSFLVRIKWTGIFWLIHFLPGFNRFRGAFHWAYIGSFALALLAGFALDNLEEIKKSIYFKKFVNFLKFFGWINIAVVGGVFLTGFFRNQILNKIFQFFDTKIYSGTRQFPSEHYHGVITSEFDKFLNAFSFSNYHFTISFASVLIAVALLILYQKNKINIENFKKTALIFTFLNLVLIWQGYYSFISQSKITEYPDTIRFIKNKYPESERYRFFRFYPPEMYQKFSIFNVKDWDDYKFKTMEVNISVYFDMENFGGLEPFMSSHIANVFDEIGYERPTSIAGEPWLRSSELSLNDKISRFSSPQNLNILSMLNIKYVFSSFKLPNLKLIYETTATEKNIPVYIYENTEVMPRIYFAKSVKFVDSKNAFEELLKVNDFHGLTLIECQGQCLKTSDKQPTFIKATMGKQETGLKIEEFKPEYVKIKTSGDGGWLVYSDANLPTWEAYIDNQKTDIYTANYLFKSVLVPKGEHEVIFKYPNLWGQNKAAVKSIFRLQ